jgi:hypothetical protein
VRVHSRLAGPAEPLSDKSSAAETPDATAADARLREAVCAAAGLHHAKTNAKNGKEQ